MSISCSALTNILRLFWTIISIIKSHWHPFIYFYIYCFSASASYSCHIYPSDNRLHATCASSPLKGDAAGVEGEVKWEQCREIRINGVHDYLCRATDRQTDKHIKKYNTKTVARAATWGERKDAGTKREREREGGGSGWGREAELAYSWHGVGRI